MRERDTHFQGFAKLLYDELSKLEGSHETLISEYRNKYDKQAIVNLMAQRAYDLVSHALMHTTPASGSTIRKFQGLSIEEIAGALPDLTEWPVEPNDVGGSNPA